MSRRLTTTEFIERARKIHGDKYDYSKTDLDNRDEKGKICIICPKHGEFWQLPKEHLRGRGCEKCSKIENGLKNRKTTEQFIKDAKKVNGDKYDYSKTNLEHRDEKGRVCIICPKHGEFWQKPANHLSGQGCYICGREKSRINNLMKQEEFINKAKQIHGDKYDYSKVKYIGNKKNVCIICPKHGEFTIRASSHLRGCGCKKCANDKLKLENTLSLDEWLDRAKKIHGDKYNYSKVKYEKMDKKVIIICPLHGEFSQLAYAHISGQGCSKCKESKLEREVSNILSSKNIKYIQEYNSKWLGKQHLDFYLPQYNIAIECQGIQHFKPVEYFGGEKKFIYRKKLDEKKLSLCLKNNILLEYINYNDNITKKVDEIIKKYD